MLFNLSVKNLKKSVSDYSIYFFTLLLGVSVFYMFNAIEDQTAMMELSQVKSNIISIMNIGMSLMSVLVSVILGFLIVYASQFLIRKRTKEFGIYLTLGMRKAAIARMLLIETFVIGMISLVIGLVTGIVLSQFMSLVVAGMFEADMDQFVFVVSKGAIIKTILYYAVIYLVVIVANTISVVRSRLIDLLLANRKKEKVYLKSPVLCLFAFAAACVLLGIAYYNVTVNDKALDSEMDILLMMIFGVIGTFLVFWSVSGFVLGFARRIKSLYFRGTNSFILNETGNRIHSFVMAGSIICLLLFVTISAMSGAFTLKNYKKSLIEKRVPVSVSMKTESTDGHRVSDTLEEREFELDALTDVTEFFTWQCDTVTRKDIYGSVAEELLEEDTMWKNFLDEKMNLICQSDYNAAASRYGFEKVDLKEDEFIAFCENPEGMFNHVRKRIEESPVITIGTQKLKALSYEEREGYLMMSDDPGYEEIVIIPDTVPEGELRERNAYLIADYKKGYDTKEFRAYMDEGGFDEQVNQDRMYTPEAVIVSTKSALTDNSVGTSGTVVFVALYIGIVFMICSAALLALKSMSDAMDGREKYKVLRQLGAGEKEVNRALRVQMGVFFGFPLLLAAIHSIFGIQVVNKMLSIYQSDTILPSLILAAGMIVVIYGGYFAASYHACKKVIKEKSLLIGGS